MARKMKLLKWLYAILCIMAIIIGFIVTSIGIAELNPLPAIRTIIGVLFILIGMVGLYSGFKS